MYWDGNGTHVGHGIGSGSLITALQPAELAQDCTREQVTSALSLPSIKIYLGTLKRRDCHSRSYEGDEKDLEGSINDISSVAQQGNERTRNGMQPLDSASTFAVGLVQLVLLSDNKIRRPEMGPGRDFSGRVLA